jgi:DNA-binding IclR family transcriptional regulator
MTYTYEQLSQMTVTQLRAIADGIEHPATKGHSTMHKEKLLPALCEALGVEARAHHVVVGINKSQVKAEIRALKTEREAALASHDGQKVKSIRRRIHNLKRDLRRHTR